MADRVLGLVGMRNPRHRRRALVWRRRLVSLIAVVLIVLAAVGWVQTRGTGPSDGVAAGGTAPGAEIVGTVPAASPAEAVPATGTRRPPAGPARTTPPSTAPPTTAPAPTVSMAFAGDLLLHMPLNRAAATFGQASGKAYDYAPMLAPLRPVLESADLALCHLEVPVAPSPDRIRGYPVFGAPAEIVAGAASAGYDGCSTASNHSLDQGMDGIAATLAAFDANRLGHTGSARSAAEAATPRLYAIKGVKVAHLSYAYGFNGYEIPADAPWATNQIDPARILADAQAARAAGAQLVVVSLHWGTENQHDPNAEQRALAPQLTASPDVDMVIGHHAHVVQPIEVINGKPVVFGLGNQLSNQTRTPQRDGLTVVVTAGKGPDGRYHALGVKAVPTWMDSPTSRVLPVARTLADPATPPGLRAELLASYQRTAAVLMAAGPVPGLTLDPLPPG